MTACNLGSPPQVRGKPGKSPKSGTGGRITPAGAGKTGWKRIPRGKNRDHPRRCGENAGTERYYQHRPGSPPQVRGKRCNLLYRHSGLWDHPRRCGENFKLYCLSIRIAGSPPQVRGKRPYKAQYRKEDRITPAGAGKTYKLKDWKFFFQDHPRRCGENTKKIL